MSHPPVKRRTPHVVRRTLYKTATLQQPGHHLGQLLHVRRLEQVTAQALFLQLLQFLLFGGLSK